MKKPRRYYRLPASVKVKLVMAALILLIALVYAATG
jgi:hypothetical protein